MRFTIKQRLIETNNMTITVVDDFDVYDGNDQIVYTVKERFPFLSWYEFRNIDGYKVGSIWNPFHSYLLFQQGYLYGSLWPKITRTGTVFALKCCGWAIDLHDDDRYSCTIYDALGEKVADISRYMFGETVVYMPADIDQNDILPLLMITLSIYILIRDSRVSGVGPD